jgi:class 3 adenylate cyclase
MIRFFFDFREGGRLIGDDIGVEFSSLEAAKAEATAAMFAQAKDFFPGANRGEMQVQVRTESGPVFKTKIIFGVDPLNLGAAPGPSTDEGAK